MNKKIGVKGDNQWNDQTPPLDTVGFLITTKSDQAVNNSIRGGVSIRPLSLKKTAYWVSLGVLCLS